MSDAPEGPDDTRGGMEAGDPGLAGATETGGEAAVNRPTGGGDDNSGQRLVGEKATDGEGL
jgi:hypothetical protein